MTPSTRQPYQPMRLGIPPWFWLIILFILPLIAWTVLAVVTSRANIQRIPVVPQAEHTP